MPFHNSSIVPENEPIPDTYVYKPLDHVFCWEGDLSCYEMISFPYIQASVSFTVEQILDINQIVSDLQLIGRNELDRLSFVTKKRACFNGISAWEYAMKSPAQTKRVRRWLLSLDADDADIPQAEKIPQYVKYPSKNTALRQIFADENLDMDTIAA